jgi:hypothetical protein
MAEIADFLEVHYATISRRLRRLEQGHLPGGEMLDCKT